MKKITWKQLKAILTKAGFSGKEIKDICDDLKVGRPFETKLHIIDMVGGEPCVFKHEVWEKRTA